MRSVGDFELRENAPEMGFYSVLGERQFVRDHFVRLAHRNEFKHRHLAIAQRLFDGVKRDLLGNFGKN